MKITYLNILLLMGLIFFTSCEKENFDKTTLDEIDDVETIFVDCTTLNVTLVFNTTALNEPLLYALVEGGVVPYAYSWSTGENAHYIQPSTDGNYSVTVTDQDGCTYTVSTVVSLSDPCQLFDATINIDKTVGGEIRLRALSTGGVPAYTYEWSTGENTSSISVVSSIESYSVTITDSNGCSSEVSVELDLEDPCLLFDVGIVLEDVSGTDKLKATIANGVPPYLYEWSTGEVVESIVLDDNSIMYSVTVTDAVGCIGTVGY